MNIFFTNMIFQIPATPIMEGIITLHNTIMEFLFVILGFVLWILLRTVYLFGQTKFGATGPVSNNTHNTFLEIVWTITPALILVVIAIPSFSLLYSMDEVTDTKVTLKVVGHQWYWTYEYSDYKDSIDAESIELESYMVADDDLEGKDLRLLEVDNTVALPVNTHIRVIVTAADVLHSWAVPSLGVKVDAVPGRLSQVSIFLKRLGTFYGQCSEICGVNHGYMPIKIESMSLTDYANWVLENTNN